MAGKSKATKRYVVYCAVHGTENKLWAGRMVRVPQPKTKRDKRAGCPVCAQQQV